MYQRIVGLNTRAAEQSSFMTPEIHRIPDRVMEGFLAAEELAPYRFFLKKILRTKPHTREESIERIMAMSREMAQTAATTFGELPEQDRMKRTSFAYGRVYDELRVRRPQFEAGRGALQ